MSQDTSPLSDKIYAACFILFLYLFTGALVSSYLAEKWNKNITVREYFVITVIQPVFLFAKINEEIQKLETKVSILDTCIIECQRPNQRKPE